MRAIHCVNRGGEGTLSREDQTGWEKAGLGGATQCKCELEYLATLGELWDWQEGFDSRVRVHQGEIIGCNLREAGDTNELRTRQHAMGRQVLLFRTAKGASQNGSGRCAQKIRDYITASQEGTRHREGRLGAELQWIDHLHWEEVSSASAGHHG